MPPHPFEIQNYYQNKFKFDSVYLRGNLSIINNWASLINTDEYKSIWTNWIALYVNCNNITYFNSVLSWTYPRKNYK